MASLFHDARTGLFVVEFYDRARVPAKRRVSTGTRERRAAQRLRRIWEGAFEEGRFDPWAGPPPERDGAPSPTAAPAKAAPARGRSSGRPPAAPTLAEARGRFLASRAHRTANTRANYDRVTGWLAAHVGAHRPVVAVTAADVEGWLATLDVRPVTRACYVRHLRSFFRYCITENLVAEDPTERVRLERVPRRFPKALRPEQVEAVAAYAEAHCRDGAARSSAWAAPLVRLGAETALRRGELLALRWEHVDLGAGVLTVACTEAFTTKSGAERRVPLSARAVAVLAAWRGRGGSEREAGPVFESAGRPVAGDTCSAVVKRFAVGAGVPALTPHALRHSCITWLLERGVPVPVVQRFAGHADVATTMRYCSIADDVVAGRIRAALAG